MKGSHYVKARLLFLVFAFLTSSYGFLSAAFCSVTKQKALLLSSRVASLYTTMLAILASFILIYLCQQDYSFSTFLKTQVMTSFFITEQLPSGRL